MTKKYCLLLSGILGIHFILLMVLKFTAWPEMTLWPYLMTKGWMPYRDIAIAHTPLALFDLAIFCKIFGVGILQLKIFTWILILLSDGLVFFVVKKLWNIKAAFTALMFYIPWMLFYDGNGLWFDLYMGILAFCSFYFARSKKWVLAGVFWALAFISKQTAVWFLIPIGLEMINSEWLMVKNILRRPFKVRPCKVAWKFVYGALIIIAGSILLLFIFNLLPSFWNWAVNFGIFVLPKAQGQIQLPNLQTLAVATFPFLIFVPLFFSQKSKIINLVFWALAGVMGAYPRFEYFHFQPAISFLAIAGALLFSEKRNVFIKVFIPLYLLGSVYLIFTYFERNINGGTRFYEKDVQDTVLYVKYNTSPNDRIFVLNYWDNIYSLTDTLPSTKPWVPQLSWYMDMLGIQEKMVEDLKDNPPKFVVYKPYTSYGLSSYVPQKVYVYLTENYKIVENIEGIEILGR